MDHERWEALVRRLEKVARTNPKGYRRRVALLAGLGFAYLGAILTLLVLATVFFVLQGLRGYPQGFLYALFPAGLALIVVRSVAVKLPGPGGVPVSRADAPALHALIDELREPLAVKPIDRVLIDERLNASAVQRPRSLLIGLPLMQALPERELRAVIGHELGHLSGNHGRFSGWIYRQRVMWSRILTELEATGMRGASLFTRFLKWYAPYFNAYTFALARDNEYVADRAAAEVAGTGHAASALVRIELAGRFESERHWTPITGHAALKATPPQDPVSALGPRIRAAAADADAPRWLAVSLARKTDHADTHPALGDRLTALGVPPGSAVEPFDDPSSVATLLGPLEQTLAARFDEEWRTAARDWWAERHAEFETARARLAALAERGDLDPDEAYEQARLAGALAGDDAALPLLEALLRETPDHARTHYALGCLRLERGDAGGLDHLETAMRLEPEATLAACDAATRFLDERGRAEEAGRYRALAKREGRALAVAYEERERFTPKDAVRPYEPAPEEKVALHAVLLEEREVAEAYLAQKDVEDHPGVPPLLVVGLRVKRPLLKPVSADADRRLAARVADALDLGAPFYVIPLNRETRRLRKRLQRTVAPVYARATA
jgi:Zn-dependent protease with chaperone function